MYSSINTRIISVTDCSEINIFDGRRQLCICDVRLSLYFPLEDCSAQYEHHLLTTLLLFENCLIKPMAEMKNMPTEIKVFTLKQSNRVKPFYGGHTI